jgi:hypothetical protein
MVERVRRPRAGFVTPHPGGPGHRWSGKTTGLRGARWTGTGNRRVTPAIAGSQETRPGAEPMLVATGVASAAAERREASAPGKQMSCAECVHLSAARIRAHTHRPMATSAGAARTLVGCASRRSAAPLCWGQNLLRTAQGSGADASRERFSISLLSACGKRESQAEHRQRGSAWSDERWPRPAGNIRGG